MDSGTRPEIGEQYVFISVDNTDKVGEHSFSSRHLHYAGTIHLIVQSLQSGSGSLVIAGPGYNMAGKAPTADARRCCGVEVLCTLLGYTITLGHNKGTISKVASSRR